jgi:chemotaxis protein methyltransferase CheR
MVKEQYGLSLTTFPVRLVELVLAKLPPNWEERDLTAPILSAFSIGETTLLRHPEQFQVFQSLLPVLYNATRSSPLHVWSAGCATGEEAYSIAAVLRRAGFANGRVLACDMNAKSLAKAESSTYGTWSTRGMDCTEQVDWLIKDGNQIKIHPDVRRMVRFSEHNLMTDAYPTGFDAVFCRNVLIYFAPEAIENFFERVARSIKPGGLLFLGYADPRPQDLSKWLPVTHEGVQYFQRKFTALAAAPKAARQDVPGEEKSSMPPPPDMSHAPKPLPSSANLQASSNAPDMYGHHEVTARQNGVREDSTAELPSLFALARGFAARGVYDLAIDFLRQLQVEHPLDAELQILVALIASEAKQPGLALEAARKAALLALSAPYPHFLLAIELLKCGERRLALDRLRVASVLLREIPNLAEPIAFGDGLTGTQLQRMIEDYDFE